MNRILALVTWIFLSIFLIGPAHAASKKAPAAPATEAQQPVTPTEPSASTTPAAALAWQEREKARGEVKKRAEALRQQEIALEEANQVPPESLVAPKKDAAKKKKKSVR